MNVLTLQSTYGGLLHDTGKAVYRAGGQRGSHSEQGYQFLHGVLPGAGWARALDCVRYHHAAALRGAAKTLPADSPAYIVYLADYLSAAADRREVEGESSFFRRDLPLDSVFTHLNGTHPGWMMPAQPQDGSLKLPQKSQPLSAAVYAEAVRTLEAQLPQGSPLNILDVGTGTGFFAILMAKLGHKVTGIDLTPAMLEEAAAMAAGLLRAAGEGAP